MPDVSYDNKPVKYELRTAPPDGYVMLRRLPFDEILKRREMGTRLSMEQESGKRSRRAKDEKQRIDIEMAQTITREYEFANCIVDHNLEVNGQPVDFTKPKQAFRLVDPLVLQEIEEYLSDLNGEFDEEELEDFLTARKQSSVTTSTKPETPLAPVS